MAQAKEMQRKLYSDHAPPVAGLDIGGLSRPVAATNGDCVDHISLTSARCALRARSGTRRLRDAGATVLKEKGNHMELGMSGLQRRRARLWPHTAGS